jgi:hypothetical protein
MSTSSDVPHAGTGIHHQPHGWSPATVTTAVARDQFEILYPMIRDFLLVQFEAHSMPQDAIEYFMRVCHYPRSFSWRRDLPEAQVSRLQHLQRKI